MTEGSNITLRNVQLLTKDTDPVLSIHNSQNITLDKITYRPDADLLLTVSGEKSKGIVINGTDARKAKKGVEFSWGATEAALKMDKSL